MINITPIVSTRNMYRLTEPYPFLLGNAPIVIPVGFEFDGASIPRSMWSIIGHPMSPRFVRAALIHDYMFNDKFGYNLANKEFIKNLKSSGVSSLKAKSMFLAVEAYAKYKGFRKWLSF